MTAAAQKHATVCPYCRGAVGSDLVRTGGNCPHCMLEIPGEEAATDPGLEVRKRHEAEAHRAHARARTRSRQISAVVLLFLGGLGAAGWMRYQKQQDELVYELGDVYMAPRDGLIASAPAPIVDATVPEGPVPSKPHGTGTTHRRPDDPARPASGVNDGGGTGSSTPSVKYVPGTSPLGDMAVPGSESGGPRASTLGSATIAVTRVNTTVLESPDEILAMAKEVTAAYQPQIMSCAAQKLKMDAAFTGGWHVAFTIGTDGIPKKIVTDALGQPDAEIEACIQRAIGRWKYQRILKEFKVQKTYHFEGTE